MLNEKHLREIACEIIHECYSEVELVDKIEQIRNALHPNLDSYQQLSIQRTRVKRNLKIHSQGRYTENELEAKILHIQQAIISIIQGITINEIALKFDRDKHYGIIYLVEDPDGNLLYRYSGSVRKGLPHGEGIAKYNNGQQYEGTFRKGNRDGVGTLFDSNRRILREGQWKNDIYVEKNAVRFYEDVTVLANAFAADNFVDESEYQLLTLPGIKGNDLYAFPVDGDSMTPTFEHGDVVVCKPILSKESIKNDKVYVILHEGSMFLKRVQKVPNLNSTFVLISDNFRQHHPFQIMSHPGTRFYKIVMQLKYHY